MSSKLIENKDNEIIIKDEKAFIFSLNKKKFSVLKSSNAIVVNNNYLICFGGSLKDGNDLYIGYNGSGGMNRKDYYGDKNYETSNNQASFTIKEFKVYELTFK